MKRLVWIFVAALLGVMGAGLRAAEAAPPATAAKPNVLCIILDDANDWNSVLGHPAKTPHLDRLAQRAVVFERAYCSAPGCTPSRTSFLTGVAPSTSGVYFNGQPFRRASHWISRVTTLPEHFRAKGYLSAGFGKVFHFGADDRGSWSEGAFVLQDPEDERLPKAAAPLVSLDRVWPYHWGALPDTWDRDDPTQMQEDTRNAVKMAELVGRRHTQPFFAMLGIHRPHVPWFAPKRFFDLYPENTITWPEGLKEGDLDDVPAAGRWLAQVNVTPDTHRALVERNLWRKAIQAYLASMSYVDEQIGRVMDALQAGPNAQNTIVFVWSDHGYHLGEKEHWNKFTLWERSARVPWLVAAPGVKAARVGTPVSLLDVYPTLVAMCGLPAPESHTLEGVNLAPILYGKQSERGRPVVTSYGRGNHAIRDARWRYIRYRDGSEELYDHRADPHEWQNLAGRPDARPVIGALERYLPQINAENVPFADKRGVKWLGEAVFGPQ